MRELKELLSKERDKINEQKNLIAKLQEYETETLYREIEKKLEKFIDDLEFKTSKRNMTAQDLINKCSELDELIRNTITCEQDGTFPILDGIIDPERFLNAKYKILWILKQPYDDFDDDGNPCGGDWDLKEVLKNKNFIQEYEGGKQTFRPMTYTSWGILNDFTTWDEMEYVQKDPTMLNALKSIAYINVCKIPGYKSTHYTVCKKAYNEYRELLLKQVELINADIIIGGGTLNHFYNDFQLSTDKWHNEGTCDYYLSDGKIYIDAYHPAQTQVFEEDYCNDIIMAVKTWNNK